MLSLHLLLLLSDGSLDNCGVVVDKEFEMYGGFLEQTGEWKREDYFVLGQNLVLACIEGLNLGN